MLFLRIDIIEVFKMIHGNDKVHIEKLICIDENGRTRKHNLCLKNRRHVNSNTGLKFSLGELKIIETMY